MSNLERTPLPPLKKKTRIWKLTSGRAVTRSAPPDSPAWWGNWRPYWEGTVWKCSGSSAAASVEGEWTRSWGRQVERRGGGQRKRQHEQIFAARTEQTLFTTRPTGAATGVQIELRTRPGSSPGSSASAIIYNELRILILVIYGDNELFLSYTCWRAPLSSEDNHRETFIWSYKMILS